jgi:hypothetical protein
MVSSLLRFAYYTESLTLAKLVSRFSALAASPRLAPEIPPAPQKNAPDFAGGVLTRKYSRNITGGYR